MEFVLNEYHRNTSDEELIADVKRVAGLLHQNTLTQKEYQQNGGKFHPATIARRIGSWNEVLKIAGLALERTNLYKRHEYCESDEAFFEDLRRISNETGLPYVTTGTYEEKGKYSYIQILKRYKMWDELLKATGLEPTPFRTDGYSDTELFEEIERVWRKLGRQPKYIDARNSNEFRISVNAICNHFGGWRKALKAFLDYKNSNKIGNNTKDYDLPQPANNKTSKGVKHELLKGINRSGRREPTERQKRLVLERDGNCCRLCGVP